MDESTINKTGEDDDTMAGVYNAWSKLCECMRETIITFLLASNHLIFTLHE